MPRQRIGNSRQPGTASLSDIPGEQPHSIEHRYVY
jgi:hypothetical protein